MTPQHSDPQRPAILDDLTVTQLTELANQIAEGDRKGFNWRAETFGWTSEQIGEVWKFFEAGRPVGNR